MNDVSAFNALPGPSGLASIGSSADSSQSQTATRPSLSLDQIALGQAMFVHALQAPEGAPEWREWLEEIGFVPGESVKVLSRGLPGGDPLVVRIAQSTFALRRAEASCVLVAADFAEEPLHV